MKTIKYGGLCHTYFQNKQEDNQFNFDLSHLSSIICIQQPKSLNNADFKNELAEICLTDT